MLLIVNVPFFFAGMWATVKGWVDEKTRSKVEIMGKDYKEKLLKIIDENQLIDFLGGTSTANLKDNIGPWMNYEIIDGSRQGDTVGIRHKQTGEIFTPTDLQ